MNIRGRSTGSLAGSRRVRTFCWVTFRAIKFFRGASMLRRYICAHAPRLSLSDRLARASSIRARFLGPHVGQGVMREDPLPSDAFRDPIQLAPAAAEHGCPAEDRLSSRRRQKGGVQLAGDRGVLET